MGKVYDYRPEIAIAAELRKYVPRQRSLLFHGSVTPCAILRSDCIRCPESRYEDIGASFSRLLHVGVYWARLGRRPDEGQGAIVVLDRDKLAQDFRLRPYCWDGCGSDKSSGDFEAEERTVGRHVGPLHKYLVAVLWLPESCRGPLPNMPAEVDREAILPAKAELKALLELLGMPTRPPRTTPQQIVQKLRHVDYLVSQGELRCHALRAVGATEVAYRRWRRK